MHQQFQPEYLRQNSQHVDHSKFKKKFKLNPLLFFKNSSHESAILTLIKILSVFLQQKIL